MSEATTTIDSEDEYVAAGIARKAVQWIWPGWVARGVLTLLDGDPGMGKSTLAVDLAAWVSVCGFRPAGGRFEEISEEDVRRQVAKGDYTGGATALIVSAEDDPARVIVPRLEAANADLERVFILDGVPGEPERALVLPDDVGVLREFVDNQGVRLIVIDPLVAFLGRGVNASSDQQVRRALHRLKQLAEETQCAIIVIRHLNKAKHLPAMYRGGGSIGILGACRIALVVGKDPADETKRVLAMNKCNFADKPASLRFYLKKRGDGSAVVWDGECDWSADEVLGKVSEEEAEARSQVGECVKFIRELLQRKGRMASMELELECKLAQFSGITVKRARKKLGVVALKHRYGWELSLRPEAKEPDSVVKCTP